MSTYDASDETTAPSTPTTGRKILYPKASAWYYKAADGIERRLRDVLTRAATALADAAATLTATQLVNSGIFTITPTVARILTTDTAVAIIAAIPAYEVGSWFEFTIVNTAAFDVTLAAGTGVTLSGKAIINNVSGSWIARIDSATTLTMYRK